jgi:MFS family permease
MPNSLAILGTSFSGVAKGRAIGIWAASGAATGALGPVLGGWLIDVASWRAIFLLNLPLAAGAIGLAALYVPKDGDGRGRSLDQAGGLLAALGLGALTWALTEGCGPAGWSGTAIAGVVLACLLFLSFGLVELRRGDQAMMPLSLFASKIFVGLTLLTVLLYGALGGLFVLLPYVLIEAAGYSAAQAGAALLPLPLVLSLTSPLMGGIAARIGPRLPLGIGPLVVAAGLLLMLRIDQDAGYWTQVLPAILVVATGLSGAVAPLTTAVLNAVDERHAGSASGLNSATARTGGLVATALLGSVLASRGGQLVSGLHGAAIVGAAICAAASLSAFLLLDGPAAEPRTRRQGSRS